MAPNIPDTYLWLGLGLFTFLAIQHVSTSLHNIRHLTRTTLSAPQPPGHPSPSESAIKTSSLLALASSHNIEISASATKLLCERFYASPAARRLLLRDLGSDKPAVQRRAHLAFRLLREHGVFRARGAGYGYGYGSAGLAGGGWEDVDVLPAVPREAGEGEERDARRRRREAVVIHDGEGRVGEGDVWMRDREGVLSLDVEAGELVIDGVVH